MQTLRTLRLLALAAALPFAAHAQTDPSTGQPPPVNLKPPPGSATPQAEGHAGPDGRMQGHKGYQGQKGRGMDTNGDGLLSRDEFTRHHEQMWNSMEKTPDGQVDIKNMHSGSGTKR